MRRFDLPINNNPLKTKKDLQIALMQMFDPLRKHYSESKAYLYLGNTGTKRFDEICSFLEGYSRPLWGLVPYEFGGGDADVWEDYLKGLKNGTDPQHKDYWGDASVSLQRYVEMTAIAVAILMLPEKMWDKLTEQEQNRVADWLGQINSFNVPHNNWCFFVIFTNLALKKTNKPYSQENMDIAFQNIEKCYLGDGWYSDGPTQQRDYYIPFAMHYYGLLYSKLMCDEDSERSELYKERAKKFAEDYIYWYSSDGSSLPFGRSLTYRFAVSAFWGALAFADVEGIDYGIVKGIYLRNLRWWIKQPIFDANGVLSIGFAYPNLVCSEGYNSPGSPYWAFKYFISLALPDDHPFWLAEEKELPKLEAKKKQEHAFMLNCRDGEHIMCFTAGQNAKWDFAHNAEKYSKFVYSNKFGFSVPKSNDGIIQGAYDSTLAISEADEYYRVRKFCEDFKIYDEYVYSEWKPWNNVTVKSWIIPLMPYHIRIHKIESGRMLSCCDGGFSIFRDESTEQEELLTDSSVIIKSKHGVSGIFDLSGNREPELILPEANTNLLYPRTYIPTLVSTHSPGNFCLKTVVLGMELKENTEEVLSCPPIVKILNDDMQIEIVYNNQKTTMCLYTGKENRTV